MTLRGGLAALAGLVLAGCYGVPLINGHDGGDGGMDASAAETGGPDVAGIGGAGGVSSGGRGASSGGAAAAAGGGTAGSVGLGGGVGGIAGGGIGGADGGGASGSGAAGAGGGAAGAASAGAGGAARGGAGGIAGGGTSGGTACNPACDATHTCISDHCLLADAQQCVTGSQCASGTCNPFYKDVDGDGYGTGQAVGFCTLTNSPIGYAVQNGDCCDDAANLGLAKLIHPGADFQGTSAGGICNGITWDYDCSGSIETNPRTVMCADNYPMCTSTMVNFPETACGPLGVDSCSCTGAGNGTTGGCLRACSGHAGTIFCK